MESSEDIGSCHACGMLDRDQRTARTTLRHLHHKDHRPVDFSSSAPSVVSDEVAPVYATKARLSQHGLPGRTSPSQSCKTRKRNNHRLHLWKRLQRLRHILVIVAYFAFFSTFPVILSAPTSSLKKMASDRHSSSMPWRNPCGVSTDAAKNATVDHTNVTTGDMLEQLVNQAKIAISKASLHKKSYVQDTFSMDPSSLHAKFKAYHYDWLPSTANIPKELGEHVPAEHKQSLTLNQSLLTTYEELQKVAVGLEQVIWDLSDQNSGKLTEFKEHLDNLYLVLCELQVTIIDRNLTVPENVNRETMPQELRANLDNTSSNIRNWLIYRDYMNVIEYIIEVFQYLKDHPEKHSPENPANGSETGSSGI